jgi:ABC-type antimicrobial peptide transport system permease subunit
MNDLQMAIVMLGCVFNVVLILMCAISIVLIYSLLMISVQKRTFDTGVMRMVGVSKMDCVLSITMQTLSFVVPSIILSYSLAILINHFLFELIYTPDMGLRVSILPSWYATGQALTLGIFIPMLSSILPI